MKKRNLTQKLTLKKETISNLNAVKGGMFTWYTARRCGSSTKNN